MAVLEIVLSLVFVSICYTFAAANVSSPLQTLNVCVKNQTVYNHTNISCKGSLAIMIEKFTFNTSEGSCLSTPNQTQSGGQFEQNSSFMEILLGNCSLSNFCDLSGTHIFDSFETPWCAEVQYSCIDLSDTNMSFCDNFNKTINKVGHLIYSNQLESYTSCTCDISGATRTTIRENLPCTNMISCTESSLEVNGTFYNLNNTVFSKNVSFDNNITTTLTMGNGTGPVRLWISFEGNNVNVSCTGKSELSTFNFLDLPSETSNSSTQNDTDASLTSTHSPDTSESPLTITTLITATTETTETTALSSTGTSTTDQLTTTTEIMTTTTTQTTTTLTTIETTAAFTSPITNSSESSMISVLTTTTTAVFSTDMNNTFEPEQAEVSDKDNIFLIACVAGSGFLLLVITVMILVIVYKKRGCSVKNKEDKSDALVRTYSSKNNYTSMGKRASYCTTDTDKKVQSDKSHYYNKAYTGRYSDRYEEVDVVYVSNENNKDSPKEIKITINGNVTTPAADYEYASNVDENKSKNQDENACSNINKNDNTGVLDNNYTYVDMPESGKSTSVHDDDLENYDELCKHPRQQINNSTPNTDLVYSHTSAQKNNLETGETSASEETYSYLGDQEDMDALKGCATENTYAHLGGQNKDIKLTESIKSGTPGNNMHKEQEIYNTTVLEKGKQSNTDDTYSHLDNSQEMYDVSTDQKTTNTQAVEGDYSHVTF